MMLYGKIIAGGIAPEIDLVILLVGVHTLLILKEYFGLHIPEYRALQGLSFLQTRIQA